MNTRFSIQYLIFFFLSLSVSCVQRIEPPIRQSAPILVVEGMITTDSTPYIVKLSYSGQFTNASTRIDSNQNFINDARVVIKDDNGDSTLCDFTSNGTYQTTDTNFVGIVGRTYTLEIYLSNGKTYLSKPEKINPVPPIDSVTVVYDSTYITDVRPTQFIISVNTHDPPGVQNNYRWTSFGYIPRKSATDFYNDNATCEQLLVNNNINILSDQFINGREIIQPVFYSPVYWHGIHFIEIKQYSISNGDFIFWKQYLGQTNNTGSILDPLPGTLIGNVYNQADSNDVALGFFSASDIFTKKIKIIPFFLQDYLLLDIAGQYIEEGDCHLIYPNTLADYASPAGWENAEEIDFH
jgi:hypothetical protein